MNGRGDRIGLGITKLEAGLGGGRPDGPGEAPPGCTRRPAPPRRRRPPFASQVAQPLEVRGDLGVEDLAAGRCVAGPAVARCAQASEQLGMRRRRRAPRRGRPRGRPAARRRRTTRCTSASPRTRRTTARAAARGAPMEPAHRGGARRRPARRRTRTRRPARRPHRRGILPPPLERGEQGRRQRREPDGRSSSPDATPGPPTRAARAAASRASTSRATAGDARRVLAVIGRHRHDRVLRSPDRRAGRATARDHASV